MTSPRKNWLKFAPDIRDGNRPEVASVPAPPIVETEEPDFFVSDYTLTPGDVRERTAVAVVHPVL